MKHTGRREGKMAGPLSAVRARRAEKTRASILRAGLKIFSEKGFQGTTMDDIALELEATKGLIYYHFKTKEEILSAILKQSPVISSLESELRAPENLPFAIALRAAVYGSLAVLDSNRDFIRFLHLQAILSSKEAEVVYNEVIDRLCQRVAEGIEHFKQTGEVRAEVNTRNWARMMVSLVTSYFLEKQIFGEHRRPDPDYLDHMIETLIGAVAAGPKPSGTEGGR